MYYLQKTSRYAPWLRSCSSKLSILLFGPDSIRSFIIKGIANFSSPIYNSPCSEYKFSSPPSFVRLTAEKNTKYLLK